MLCPKIQNLGIQGIIQIGNGLFILRHNAAGDTMFSDITMDDSQERIIVKSIHDENFSLTIQPYTNVEESLLQWFRENPISLTMVFMMVYLVESEIVDLKTARGYMREITLRADKLQEKYSDRWF